MDNSLESTQASSLIGEFDEEIPFSIAARVIYQLGEQLIANEYVALAELIKNSYDADCTSVRIIVDTNADTESGKGQIVIIDNGNGMTRTIIQKSFLKISTDFKCVEKYSPGFRRRSLGEKGLGRLSIQRLGNYLELTTTPRLDVLKLLTIIPKEDFEFHKNYNVAGLKVNWLAFLTANKDFSEMKTKCQYSHSERPIFGTKMVISGIRNLNFWNLDKRMKTRIKSEIFGMVNPFIQDSNEKFEVDLEINGEKFSNTKINQNVLKIMSDIFVSFSFKDWKLNIKILYKRKYLEKLCENNISSMKNKGFDKYNKLIEFEDIEENHIIDLSTEEYKLKYTYLEHIIFHNVYNQDGYIAEKYYFLNNKERVFTPSDRNKKFYSKKPFKVGRSLKRCKLAYPGDFYGVMYVNDQSNENFNIGLFDLKRMGYVFSTQKELKAIWDSAKGVYLFRNNFRILPYGPDTDWLAFTSRSQRMKANAYKEHTVSGYVQLESVTSERLKEQTNRLGLIQDEYGSNFLAIMKEVVAYISFKSDTSVREGFNIPEIKDEDNEIKTKNGKVVFYRTIIDQKKKEEIVDEIKSVSDKIASKNMDSDSIFEATAAIKKKIDQLTYVFNEEEQQNKQKSYEYEKRLDYFKSLIGLAGQSIVVEALTHEMHRTEENIKTYAEKTIEQLESTEVTLSLGSELLIDYQEKILNQIDYLEQQLAHLEPTYRKNSLIIESINLKSFLENLYIGDTPMGRKASKEGISICISGDDFPVKANKGMLITIFDNFFINSIYWIRFAEKHGNIVNKKIYFNINKSKACIEIWDTGTGIHPQIEGELFLPEESMKENGRGLGLFIVRELMNYLNGKVVLDKLSRNAHGCLYKFLLTFDKNSN